MNTAVASAAIAESATAANLEVRAQTEGRGKPMIAAVPGQSGKEVFFLWRAAVQNRALERTAIEGVPAEPTAPFFEVKSEADGR